MSLDERARHELFLRLEAVLGPKQAETLMEMMPPAGWADVATKRDLDAVGHRIEATEHKLLAAFRGELLAAVTAQANVISAQTRTLVLANLGAVLSTAALAFGAARLA
ncbi:MAG: hypothetical protein ACRDZ7_20905 [Acidimicrobiia bacterium]